MNWNSKTMDAVSKEKVWVYHIHADRACRKQPHEFRINPLRPPILDQTALPILPPAPVASPRGANALGFSAAGSPLASGAATAAASPLASTVGSAASTFGATSPLAAGACSKRGRRFLAAGRGDAKVLEAIASHSDLHREAADLAAAGLPVLSTTMRAARLRSAPMGSRVSPRTRLIGGYGPNAALREPTAAASVVVVDAPVEAAVVEPRFSPRGQPLSPATMMMPSLMVGGATHAARSVSAAAAAGPRAHAPAPRLDVADLMGSAPASPSGHHMSQTTSGYYQPVSPGHFRDIGHQAFDSLFASVREVPQRRYSRAQTSAQEVGWQSGANGPVVPIGAREARFDYGIRCSNKAGEELVRFTKHMNLRS
jgi:hypothetical protein